MMMSAVGPVDVSVDRSTLTGQRSTVKGQVSGHRAPLVSLGTRLTGGPLGSGLGKEKEKGSRFDSGPKVVLGRLKAHRLGLGSQISSGFSSACGSAGRLRQRAGYA
jgi:hypothetical protein